MTTSTQQPGIQALCEPDVPAVEIYDGHRSRRRIVAGLIRSPPSK